MNKKNITFLFIIIFFSIIFFLLYYYKSNNGYKTELNNNVTNIDVVETVISIEDDSFYYPYLITINKESISSKGVELIFDDSISSYNWSTKYFIEKYEDNKWSKVDFIESPIFDLVSIKNIKNEKIDWSPYYGELKKGYYRIVRIGGTYIVEQEQQLYQEQFYYSEPFEIKN